MLLRDYRSKEIRILIAVVLCAVVCLTAIGFSIDSVKQKLNATSATLLGGDRVISAGVPIAENIINLAKDLQIKYTKTITFYSMLSTDKELMLASIKAVEPNYPLLGALQISTNLNSLGLATNEIPSPGEVWIEARAALQLDIIVGDYIDVGNAKLKVVAILTNEPDRIADGFTFAPRVIMNMNNAADTLALLDGSRAEYKLLIVGSPAELAAFDAQLIKILPKEHEVKTVTTKTNAFKNLDLATNYLTLGILINIVLAAVAVSVAANRYSTMHMIDAAILRCLGASSRQIMVMYSSSLLFAAIVIGLLGSAIGFVIHQIIAAVLLRYINLELPNPGIMPMWLGILCALVLVMGVGLPAILALTKVPPLQVLQRATRYTKNNNWRLKFNLSHRLPTNLKLSLNNIAYNSQNNLLQVLAFALVICVALLLFVIRGDLLNSWQLQLPQSTPNYFALNIPAEIMPQLSKFLTDNKIQSDNFYPIIRGTLIKINQQEVDIDQDDANKRTGINRPLNLTWTKKLPVGNQILSGKWFEKTANDHSISIENQIAQRLNVTIGDELTFLVNTEEVSGIITSIRSVQWDSFTANFYVIFADGVMDNFPITYMNSFYVPANKEKQLLTLVKEFPQINLINVAAMIDQLKVILSLLSLVIGFIWGITLCICILLLIAIVLASINVRIYQNNLMRILGASKRQLQNILILEFIILGVTAGLIGSVVAIFTARFVSQNYFGMHYQLNWYILLLGCLFGMVIMLLGGLLGTRRALNSAPIQITREI